MPQEDKIKREIDRAGLMLAKLLNKLLDKGFKQSEAMTVVQQQFRDELDIDIAHFLAMNDGDDVLWLADGYGFTIEHLRNFGNLLYTISQKTSGKEQKELLRKKALNVYEYIHTHHDGTVYLDVEYRIKELR